MSDEPCREIERLRLRFERHMDEHRLDEHDYNDRQLKQDLARAENMKLTEANTKAIADLARSVQPLVDGITVLVVLQKLVKWLSGFAFIGVIATLLVNNNPFKG